MKHLLLLAGGERRGDKRMEDLNNGHGISALIFEGFFLSPLYDVMTSMASTLMPAWKLAKVTSADATEYRQPDEQC
jgi:hypothetical protein